MHVFGRKPTMKEREKDREREKGKRPLKVDTFLSAPDLLARHLLIRRDSAVPDTPSGQGTNMCHKQMQLQYKVNPVTLAVKPFFFFLFSISSQL